MGQLPQDGHSDSAQRQDNFREVGQGHGNTQITHIRERERSGALRTDSVQWEAIYDRRSVWHW